MAIVKAEDASKLVKLRKLLDDDGKLHLYTPLFFVEKGEAASLEVDKEAASEYHLTIASMMQALIAQKHAKVHEEVLNGNKVLVSVEYIIPEFNSRGERQLDSELLVYSDGLMGDSVFMPIAFLEMEPVTIVGIDLQKMKVLETDPTGRAVHWEIKYSVTDSATNITSDPVEVNWNGETIEA